MSDLEVRIVQLEPMRVACVNGFGEHPEEIAWTKILDFARSKGLLDNLQGRRFFGFNNPDPSPASPNYGYDQWITVGPDVKPAGDVEVKTFEGGMYAVTRCKLSHIGETWQKLVVWCEDSPYKMASHQWLEEALTPQVMIDSIAAASDESQFDNMMLDLYAPITK